MFFNFQVFEVGKFRIVCGLPKYSVVPLFN